MAIRGIAFDLEGPIFDFEHLHFEAHRLATERVLGEQIKVDWIVEHIPNAVGGGDPLIAHGIARQYRASTDVGEQLLQKKREIFRELRAGKPISARPGALDAVEWLLTQGFSIAIGSNTPRDSAHEYLRSVGLWRANIPIILAEDIGTPKPAPDVYLGTAERLGIAPREQLVFDDSDTGLQAAHDAGSPRIATPLHRHPVVMEKIERWTPLRIIHDWREIDLPTLMDHVRSELSK